jgi:two-component system response regulator DegU
METLKILIADDHPIFLKGLKEMIEKEAVFKVVAQVPNGQEALYAFQTHKIDVGGVILYLSM